MSHPGPVDRTNDAAPGASPPAGRPPHPTLRALGRALDALEALDTRRVPAPELARVVATMDAIVNRALWLRHRLAARYFGRR